MALAQLLERDRHKYADAEYQFLQVCVRDLDNRISVKSPAAQKKVMVQFLKDLQQAAYRYQGQPIPLASLQQNINPRQQRGFRQPYVHSYYVPPQPPLFQNWTRPAATLMLSAAGTTKRRGIRSSIISLFTTSTMFQWPFLHMPPLIRLGCSNIIPTISSSLRICLVRALIFLAMGRLRATLFRLGLRIHRCRWLRRWEVP